MAIHAEPGRVASITFLEFHESYQHRHIKDHGNSGKPFPHNNMFKVVVNSHPRGNRNANTPRKHKVNRHLSDNCRNNDKGRKSKHEKTILFESVHIFTLSDTSKLFQENLLTNFEQSPILSISSSKNCLRWANTQRANLKGPCRVWPKGRLALREVLAGDAHGPFPCTRPASGGSGPQSEGVPNGINQHTQAETLHNITIRPGTGQDLSARNQGRVVTSGRCTGETGEDVNPHHGPRLGGN